MIAAMTALIPALLPAQLKLSDFGTVVKGIAVAHSGFIAGSIETGCTNV